MSAPCAQLGLAAAPSCCPQMSKEPSQGTARRLPSNLINGTEPCVGVRARCCALPELPGPLLGAALALCCPCQREVESWRAQHQE